MEGDKLLSKIYIALAAQSCGFGYLEGISCHGAVSVIPARCRHAIAVIHRYGTAGIASWEVESPERAVIVVLPVVEVQIIAPAIGAVSLEDLHCPVILYAVVDAERAALEIRMEPNRTLLVIHLHGGLARKLFLMLLAVPGACFQVHRQHVVAEVIRWIRRQSHVSTAVEFARLAALFHEAKGQLDFQTRIHRPADLVVNPAILTDYVPIQHIVVNVGGKRHFAPRSVLLKSIATRVERDYTGPGVHNLKLVRICAPVAIGVETHECAMERITAMV